MVARPRPSCKGRQRACWHRHCSPFRQEASAMQTVAGIFATRGAAERAAAQLEALGIPRDDLFLYEDALRRGRSVLIALLEDDTLAARAREVLDAAGAEGIDTARERWWVGLRSAEQEHYEGGIAAFDRDEALFRRGFE